MNNLKEMINSFDYVCLEVVDAWQFPAVYIAYKSGFIMDDLKEEHFTKELSEKEYLDLIQKLKSLNLDEWLYDYLPERTEKIEEEYTWKFIVSQNGKKVVKKGKNKSPNNFEELENLMIEITYRGDEK